MTCCDHFSLPAINSLAAATPNNKTAHLDASVGDVKNDSIEAAKTEKISC